MVDVLGEHIVVASSAAWVELHRPLVEAALLRALGPSPSSAVGAAPDAGESSCAESSGEAPPAGLEASAPLGGFGRSRAAPAGRAGMCPEGFESRYAASSHGGTPEAGRTEAAPAGGRGSADMSAAAGRVERAGAAAVFGGAGQWRLVWRPSVDMLREEGLDVRQRDPGTNGAESPGGLEGATTSAHCNGMGVEREGAADELTAAEDLRDLEGARTTHDKACLQRARRSRLGMQLVHPVLPHRSASHPHSAQHGHDSSACMVACKD